MNSEIIKIAYSNHKDGNFDIAEKLYKQILEIDIDNPNILHLLGVLYIQKSQYLFAKKYLKKACSLKPNSPEYLSNLGIVYKKEKQYKKAILQYQKALQLASDNPQITFNYADLLKEANLISDAKKAYLQTIKIAPNFVDAYNDLSVILRNEKKNKEAFELLKRAIKIKPDFAEAYNNLGVLCLDEDDMINEAVYYFEKAVAINKNYIDALINLAKAYYKAHNTKMMIKYLQIALKYKPDSKAAQSHLFGAYAYSVNICPDFVFEQHCKWAQLIQKKKYFNFDYIKKDTEKKLKIGYISPDFRSHSVSCFMYPILKNHDHNSFQIFAYSDTTNQDHITQKLAGFCDKFRDISDLNDDFLYKLIINDKIDILIDLAGHTINNRLHVFAQKPAPVQITYLGYPNTTGLSTIDYRITDNFADPIGMTDKYYSEKLIRLSNIFLCYSPFEDVKSESKPPVYKNGFITFGSFNISRKINTEVIKIWANILKQIPDSCLLLKNVNFDSNYIKDLFYSRFEDFNISRNRIHLFGKISSLKKHFEMYNKIDISLDTFPYNGTTTTFDSLWMGVPVITLKSNVHIGRVGTTILKNLSLHDFIANSYDSYIEKAVELAKNKELIISLKKNIRNIMIKSKLLDGKKFTIELEAVYRQVWKDWCLTK